MEHFKKDFALKSAPRSLHTNKVKASIKGKVLNVSLGKTN